MPTFQNDTNRLIECRATLQTEDGPKKVLVQFPPKPRKGPAEAKKLPFWVPWREAGLTLVDPEWPPAPQVTLVSGTFDFEQGMTREFAIPECGKYVVDLIVQSGRVKLYAGGDKAGAEIVKNTIVPFRYRGFYDWEQAPRLRLVGMEEDTRATLHVEAGRGRIEDLPCR